MHRSGGGLLRFRHRRAPIERLFTVEAFHVVRPKDRALLHTGDDFFTVHVHLQVVQGVLE